MGNNSAASECQKCGKKVEQRFKGVTEIKYDILVHGTDQNHEPRLRAVLPRLQEEKCKLGMTEVEWFGHRISGTRMRVAEDKAQVIQQWPKPTTVKELKRFLATPQLNADH